MSISLDGLNGNLYDKATNESTSTASKMQDTLNSDLTNASSDKLMKVCKDFEAYFTEQVFKSMSKMVPENEEESSSYASSLKNYYKESMIQRMASDSVENQGLGLAQQLYESMKRNYGIEE